MEMRRDIIRRRIMDLLAADRSFTDIQINVTMPIRVRTSSGLLAASDHLVSDEDLGIFLRGLRPGGEDWNASLDAHGGHADFGAVIDNSRFRCNLYRFHGGLRALSMRKLFTPVPAPGSLGLPDVVLELAGQSRGLLLVTGPTGAGKSTTLASLIGHINSRRGYHIITIEDPIEYELSSDRCVISQREIGRDCDGFASALTAALRQHPDVIMVGEARNFETIDTAIQAAASGHLVLASMHTASAVKTIERIVGLYPGADQASALNTLSSVLIGVVSQVLVEASDRGSYELCYEVLVNTPAVQALLHDGMFAQIANVMQTGSDAGMNTLNQVLAEKVRRGQIHRKDAFFYSYDTPDLRRLLDGDSQN